MKSTRAGRLAQSLGDRIGTELLCVVALAHVSTMAGSASRPSAPL